MAWSWLVMNVADCWMAGLRATTLNFLFGKRGFTMGKLGEEAQAGMGEIGFYQEGRGSLTSRSRRSELSAVVSWSRR